MSKCAAQWWEKDKNPFLGKTLQSFLVMELVMCVSPISDLFYSPVNALNTFPHILNPGLHSCAPVCGRFFHWICWCVAIYLSVLKLPGDQRNSGNQFTGLLLHMLCQCMHEINRSDRKTASYCRKPVKCSTLFISVECYSNIEITLTYNNILFPSHYYYLCTVMGITTFK